MLDISSNLRGGYSPKERAEDAEEAWQLCNQHSPDAYLSAPGDIITPNALKDRWAADIRRCLYYIAATGVPPKQHGLGFKSAIRVHPTVVHMLTKSDTLLRVDPAEDWKPSSFSCNILLGALVVQETYYRELIPFYFQLEGTKLRHLMTHRRSASGEGGGTGLTITDPGWNRNYKLAIKYVRGELATGAERGVIVRLINQTHMIAVLLLGYHAYIFDHNTTNETSAMRTMDKWHKTLHAFLVEHSPIVTSGARTSTQIGIPDRLHGINIHDSGNEMVIGNHIWKIGVAFHLGPQPGNGDCQRGTSNIISRLLTTEKQVQPADYYVSKKIHLVWSWVLLDAIANAYPELDYPHVWQIYVALIALYEYTRRINVPSRVFHPIPGPAGQLQATLMDQSVIHTYNVWRWDGDTLTWENVGFDAYGGNPYQYSLYIMDKSEAVHYRLVQETKYRFTLGEREVIDYSYSPESASAASSTYRADPAVYRWKF